MGGGGWGTDYICSMVSNKCTLTLVNYICIFNFITLEDEIQLKEPTESECMSLF